MCACLPPQQWGRNPSEITPARNRAGFFLGSVLVQAGKRKNPDRPETNGQLGYALCGFARVPYTPPNDPPVYPMVAVSIVWQKLDEMGQMSGSAGGFDENDEPYSAFGEEFYLKGPGAVTAYASDGTITAQIYFNGVLVGSGGPTGAGGDPVVCCGAVLPSY